MFMFPKSSTIVLDWSALLMPMTSHAFSSSGVTDAVEVETPPIFSPVEHVSCTSQLVLRCDSST